MTIDIDTLGRRLIDVRLERRLSQTKFAKFIDVSQSYLGAIETGKRKPSFNFIVSVLNATKISSDWLLTGEGPMYPSIKKEKQEIKEINEERAAYGGDKLLGLEDVINILKNYWDKLSEEQKRVLVGMVKEMVKNNEILLEENRRLKDFLIKIATKQPGEIPSNVVQGLAD
jgi:transcriptional regulator with XRE-family HTH domain